MNRHRLFAWLGFVVLVFLHLDFWRPQRVELYWGWLPEEMAYRILWFIGDWLYVLYICGWVWQSSAPSNGR